MQKGYLRVCASYTNILYTPTSLFSTLITTYLQRRKPYINHNKTITVRTPNYSFLPL